MNGFGTSGKAGLPVLIPPRAMVQVPILTYHSHNIRGDGPADNDHAALAADLRAIHQAGLRITPLHRVVSWLEGNSGDEEVAGAVCLTFDDGCDFDVRDIDYPGYGMQRSFLGIMEDFRANMGRDAQPGLHATTFVIASREARETIDATQLFGQGWIGQDWWREVDAKALFSVESHGWDHNHPDLPGEGRGGFSTVDTYPRCLQQVVRAGEAIEAQTGRWPVLFAYPFGESSAFIREHFFPGHPEVHGCRAALGTEPGTAGADSDRWNLPRYVCGRDWRSPEELIALIL